MMTKRNECEKINDNKNNDNSLDDLQSVEECLNKMLTDVCLERSILTMNNLFPQDLPYLEDLSLTKILDTENVTSVLDINYSIFIDLNYFY